MTAQSPIVNAGLKYCNGMTLSWVSDFVLSLDAGAARDSSNTNDITLNAPVLINGKNTGPNGVDVGAAANSALSRNSLYAVYVIGDSTDYSPSAGLLSLNGTQPSLPSGYDMYRRVGWVSTDDTVPPDVKLRQWTQYGTDQTRTYSFHDTVTVLTAGASATYALVPLALGITPTTTWPAVPPLASKQVVMNITVSAGETLDMLPYSLALVGQAAPRGAVLLRNGGTSDTIFTVTVPTDLTFGLPRLVYKITGGTTSMFVAGFVDVLE